MKKSLNILFIFVLITQSMFASVGFSNTVEAEGLQKKINTNKVSYVGEDGTVVDPDEHEGTISVQVDWSMQNDDIEARDTATVALVIAEKIDLNGDQSGELVFEGNKIANFNANTEGIVSVEFTAGVEEVEAAELKGTFTLKGQIEAEEVEISEDSGESDELDEDSEQADEESTSGSNENQDEKMKADESELKEDEGDSEDKESNKTANAVQANDDGNEGFSLQLGGITDLEDKEFDEQHPMDPHKEFKLKLDWKLYDGHTYEAGDTETFDLPKEIKINETISIELRDDAGQLVANAIITPDNKVELTFTDYVEQHSDVNGWLEIISKLNEQEVEVEDGNAIIGPIGEEGELRIPIDEGNKDKTIEKSGEPNKEYNADEINWEVIVNKNKTSLTDALVTDVLPKGTEYKEGSLVVTKLKLDLNGNITGDLETVEITPEVNENGELIIPLGNISDAHRIEYITTVIDDDATEFENNATLIDTDLEDISAKSTITINRGEPLKKSIVSHNRQTNTLAWEVQFNYNQKDLSNVTFKDAWTPPDTLDFVEGSLKFQEVSIDADGKAENVGDPVDLPSGAGFQKDSDGFEVTGITTKNAYKITYETKIKDRVLEGFSVSNTVSFGDESVTSGVRINQNYGAKSAGTIDYDAKTIEWTITINNDEWPMGKISVEDTLGDGLNLVKDSINITVNGEAYTGEYTLSGDNPFTITFPEEFTTDKKILITYETKFDADKVPDYKPTNKAAITWTPQGESDSITKEIEADTELNKETKDNSWKNGSYNPVTKEITWEIITNYRENDIANLIIKDAPEGNQKIIAGSAVVKELNIAADGKITEGDTVEDVATINEIANTLEVNIGKTNKAYKIIYKTSLAGLDDMQNEYVNKAEVFDGEDSLSQLDAKVGVVKDRKYGNKSGKQDGKQVHWTIQVNLVQQKVQDLKLKDFISENQAYLEDSIKVYHAIMDTNGNVSRGEEVPTSEYDLIINETEFTIEWKNVVEHAFIVDYSTLFFEKHNGTVSNDYKVTGDSISETDQDASDSSNVTISQLGSGGGEGTAGYLVIDKIDTTNGQVVTSLAGAEFDLIDPDTGKVLKTGTTDENGQIDFGRLLFGDYQLKETKVPEGYVTPKEEQTITIDQAYKPGDDKDSFEYTVENYKPVFAIELLKIDATDKDKLLLGAEFTLFDSEDKELEKATTDKDGKILFEGLEKAGTYYVQETKAPAGYELDDTKHEVTVGEKEKEPVQVSIDNKPRNSEELTSVSGTKTWLDNDAEDRPESITIHLLANGEKVDTVKVNAENGWKYEFTKLDKNDKEGKGITYTVEEEAVEGYISEIDGFNVTNTRSDKKDIEITKTWLDDDAKDRPEKIEVELFRSVENSEKESVNIYEITAAEDWKLEIKDLPSFNTEGKSYTYEIEEEAVEGYEADIDGFDITNLRVGETKVEGTKIWLDDNSQDRPESITIQLFANGNEIDTTEVTADSDWKYAFTDLPKYDSEGKEIAYTVDEEKVDGYEKFVEGNDITNVRIGTTEVTVNKSWQDDESNDRPGTIKINLLQNGEFYGEYEVKEENDWKLNISNLPKYDEKGKAYEYSVTEYDVAGYASEVDGFEITNTRSDKKDIEITKTWLDDDAKDRPGKIEVELFRSVENSEKESVNIYEITVAEDWKLEIKDLPSFNAEGKAYTYEIEEKVVDGYETIINGFDIINTRVGEVNFSGMKTWLDDNSEDRPETITVKLFANGEKKDSQIVMGDKNGIWIYKFTNLPQYDENGVEINYSVDEEKVKGYDTIIDGHNITNLRVGTTEVSGTKLWKEVDSQYRPESITVNLLADGKQIDTIEVSKDTEWSYTFTELAKFDEEGHEIEYTVWEMNVPGYTTKVDGYNITNTQETTEVSGTKTWKDNNSKDRPESITVQVLNGTDIVKEQVVTAEDDWKYTFMELAKYDQKGNEIDYTINELPVPGYSIKIDGTDITNTRTSEVDVNGTKTWKDDHSNDRPESITVELLANGEKVDAKEVTSETDWKYNFTSLAAYDSEGVAIEYTVNELEVEGYETIINGYDITNVLAGTTSVSVEKIWENDDVTNRPDSITVDLLQNGTVIKTVEITSEAGWTHDFTELDAYDENGVQYAYTIEEHAVEGYDSAVEATAEGYKITNTFIGVSDDPVLDPGKPGVDPEGLEDHQDPTDLEKANDSKDKDQIEGSLPNTATNTFNMMLVGVLLFTVGIGFMLYRRKKT